GRHVGVEAHQDATVEHVAGCGRRDLRRAAEPGRTAEPVVERHGCERHSDHDGRERPAGTGDQEVASTLLRMMARGVHGDLVRSVHLAYNGRFSTPGPFTSVTTEKQKTNPPGARA